MEIRDILAIQKKSVDDAKAEIVTLTAEQLAELRALEVAEGDGKTRTTLVKAIDARIAQLAAADPNVFDTTDDVISINDATVGDGTSDQSMPIASEQGASGDGTATGDHAEPSTVLQQAGTPTVYVTEDRCREIVAEAVAAAEKRLATAAANGVNVSGGDASPRITGGLSALDDADDAERERQARADEVAAQIRAGEEAEQRAHEARIEQQRQQAGMAQAAYSLATAGSTSRDVRGVAQDGGRLFFSDGTRFLPEIGGIEVRARVVTITNGKIVVNQVIDFDPSLPSALVTEVWLGIENGAAFAKCDVPGGLRVGSGHEAQLPSGHLAFDLTA